MKVYHVHQNLRRIAWLMGWNSGANFQKNLNLRFCWNLNTSFISGGERTCIENIEICARMGEWWGEIRVQIAPGILSPYLNTRFCWNLNTSSICGGQRRCIKHIKICASERVTYGTKLGCKKAPRTLSTFLYTVHQWNSTTNHLWWRTNVYKAHQNLRPNGWLMGWNWGAKEHLAYYLLI